MPLSPHACRSRGKTKSQTHTSSMSQIWPATSKASSDEQDHWTIYQNSSNDSIENLKLPGKRAWSPAGQKTLPQPLNQAPKPKAPGPASGAPPAKKDSQTKMSTKHIS